MTDNQPATDLRPEVLLNMHLEGIFMPRARVQRDDFYAKHKKIRSLHIGGQRLENH